MIKREYAISRYFPDLMIYTKEDRKVLQEIFVRRIKNKVERSNKYIRSVIYTKNVRIVDTTHKFYNEYSNLKIGTLNWFETLSKSFRSYIGWYLQNKYMFDNKLNNNVPDYLLFQIESKCQSEVVSKFYDEYLDDDGIVKSEVLDDYYFKRKLEENYYFVGGYNKRFFTLEDAKKFFSIIGNVKANEENMSKYNKPKMVIEVEVEKQ